MNNKKEMKDIDLLKSMKLVYFFFKLRTKYIWLYSIIVPGIIFMRSFFDWHEMKILDQIVKRTVLTDNATNSFNISTSEMLMFMMFKFMYWSSEFVIKMTLEVVITPLGAIIASHIMKNMLGCEDYKVFDVSASACEYSISEGSKSIAKIARYIYINGLVIVMGITRDFLYIYKNFSNTNKVYSLVFMFISIGLAYLKLLHFKRGLKYSKQASDANYNKEKQYVETINQLMVVKTSGDESKMLIRYKKSVRIWETLSSTFNRFQYSNIITFSIANDCVIALTMIIFINSLFKVANNIGNETNLSTYIGPIQNYNMVLLRIPSLFSQFINLYKNLSENVVLSHNLMDYLDFKQENTDTKVRIDKFNQRIKIANLRYTAREKLIFDGVNLEINKGDKIALIGANGTGKSSMFKLILGFDDYQGSIHFDDIDIKNVCMSDYRSLITYVPQDTKLLDGTIFYNISFGNNRTFKDIIDECKKLKIHDTIMGFPNGYNTYVGDGGKFLNGGLRQKLYYARALLTDAEIYMFDEPTNNLDSTHSNFLLDYLNDPRFADKTFFVICHDLELVKSFPKLVHLVDGRIKESLQTH